MRQLNDASRPVSPPPSLRRVVVSTISALAGAEPRGASTSAGAVRYDNHNGLTAAGAPAIPRRRRSSVRAARPSRGLADRPRKMPAPAVRVRPVKDGGSPHSQRASTLHTGAVGVRRRRDAGRSGCSEPSKRRLVLSDRNPVDRLWCTRATIWHRNRDSLA